MPISSQLSASRLIQPGVCTSTTRPATPFQGQCIYETDTNRLYVWNGSAWVIPNQTTQNVDGLELVRPTGVTNGSINSSGTVSANSSITSLTVTGAFSSTYDNYRIIWSGATMTSSSGDSQLNFQLGPSSVSNYNTAYYTILIYSNGSSNSTANQSNSGQFVWAGGGSTGSALFQMDIYCPYVAVHTRMQTSGYNSWNDSYLGVANGVHKASNQYTDFTINVTGTGTISGGTLYIYGYRK